MVDVCIHALIREVSMPAKALLVGINGYAKVPLRGCVNDVVQVRDLLTQRYRLADDRIRFITDAAATKAAIADGLRWLAQTDPGETTPVRLFHFSGHGVFTPDNDHDEQDGRDECLVPVDYQTAGYIADDTLHESYARFSADTHLLLLMDCCHSGGSQKDIANDIVYRYLRGTDEEEAHLNKQIETAAQRNRELKAAFVRDSMTELLQHEAGSMSESELDRRIKAVIDQFDKIHYGLEAMPGNATLIAACRADQVAADARFDESYHGALTYYLTEALAGAGGQMPYSALIKQVGQAMGGQFTQVPQLECSKEHMDLPFLRDAIG